MSEEEWRAIPGVVGYEASTHGRIRSLTRVIIDRLGRGHRRQGKVLALSISSTGYPHANLGSQGQWDAHRLIALTFLGEPDPGMQVRHYNGVRTDIRVENLRYGTPKDNAQDAIRRGTHRGSAVRCPQNHPYDEANTYIRPDGGRQCRECTRRRHRERMRQRRAA